MARAPPGFISAQQTRPVLASGCVTGFWGQKGSSSLHSSWGVEMHGKGRLRLHHWVDSQPGRCRPRTYLSMHRWEIIGRRAPKKNACGFSALSERGIFLHRKENSPVEDIQLSSSDIQGSHVHTKTMAEKLKNILPEKCTLSLFSILFYLHLPLINAQSSSSSNIPPAL